MCKGVESNRPSTRSGPVTIESGDALEQLRHIDSIVAAPLHLMGRSRADVDPLAGRSGIDHEMAHRMPGEHRPQGINLL